MKILKKIIITLLIILFLIITITVIFVYNKLNKVEHVKLTNEDLQVSKNIDNNYRNIALFGVDSRNMDSDLGSRSDGIIILSINDTTKEMKLFSVYRDTYVEVEGHDLTKITHAYAYGGPSLAIRTLNKNLDLNITDFVTVNFEAVAEAIDLIGGVEIKIEEDEIEPLNSAISETARVTGKPADKITAPGVYNLNGVQATAYGRVRYTEGGDYKRTERMRTVIERVFAKAKQMELNTLNKVIDTVLPKVQTSMDVGKVLGLTQQLTSYKLNNSKGWPYETRGITLDAWYGIPVTLETNVQKLHQEMFNQQNYEVPETIKTISNKIIEKTGYNK